MFIIILLYQDEQTQFFLRNKKLIRLNNKRQWLQLKKNHLVWDSTALYKRGSRLDHMGMRNLTQVKNPFQFSCEPEMTEMK